MMKRFLITLIRLLSNISLVFGHCMPQNTTCWPNQNEWFRLKQQVHGRLYKLEVSNYKDCLKYENDEDLSSTGHGICMQDQQCSKEYCVDQNECFTLRILSKNLLKSGVKLQIPAGCLIKSLKDNITFHAMWNLPAYSIEVKTITDIQKAFRFSNKYNIRVSVKTTGHSYSGSSTGKGSLLLWMKNFQKYGNIVKMFIDSCGTKHGTYIKVGGGQTWGEIYHAVGSRYHIVGGHCDSVSAAGGWLMGGGLSSMSRKYGLGIDNVLRFELVLPNGKYLFVDSCSKPDLFWALRGGGGGTYGVVVAVYYKLYPAQQIVIATMDIKRDEEIHQNDQQLFHRKDFMLNERSEDEVQGISSPFVSLVDKWIDFWVEESPQLHNQWGGYWTLSLFQLYFLGNETFAEETFLKKFKKWKESLPTNDSKLITFSTQVFPNFHAAKEKLNKKSGCITLPIANRLIPHDWVISNPKQVKKTLKWLARNGFETTNYLLGGTMTEKTVLETSVHPSMRKALWQIGTFGGEQMIDKLREVFKHAGAGYNHGSKSEPNWRYTFWGNNYRRLLRIKQKVDQQKRLNCWHCVGYIHSHIIREVSNTNPPFITQRKRQIDPPKS